MHCRELAKNAHRQTAEPVSVKALLLRCRELAKRALRQTAELVAIEAQLVCNAVSWPMLSGKLLYGIVGDTLVGARGGRPPGQPTTGFVS